MIIYTICFYIYVLLERYVAQPSLLQGYIVISYSYLLSCLNSQLYIHCLVGAMGSPPPVPQHCQYVCVVLVMCCSVLLLRYRHSTVVLRRWYLVLCCLKNVYPYATVCIYTFRLNVITDALQNSYIRVITYVGDYWLYRLLHSSLCIFCWEKSSQWNCSNWNWIEGTERLIIDFLLA
jgi:hypothetical protein